MKPILAVLILNVTLAAQAPLQCHDEPCLVQPTATCDDVCTVQAISKALSKAQTKAETPKVLAPPTTTAPTPTSSPMFNLTIDNLTYVPFDVPPISETYWMEQIFVCTETCPTPRTSLIPVDGWKQYSSLTCADKTRFLMTAEDGSQHCLALTPAGAKGGK